MPAKKTILCVDSDNDYCELLTYMFNNIGLEVVSCHTPEEGIRYARTDDFSAIITEYDFDGITGIDICRAIRSFDQVTPIIFFTHYLHPEIENEAIEVGAQAYITKSIDFERFEQTVLELIDKTGRE